MCNDAWIKGRIGEEVVLNDETSDWREVDIWLIAAVSSDLSVTSWSWDISIKLILIITAGINIITATRRLYLSSQINK